MHRKAQAILEIVNTDFAEHVEDKLYGEKYLSWQQQRQQQHLNA